MKNAETIERLNKVRPVTNNILHLVLTIFTLGFWGWVWIYKLWSHERQNRKIDEQIGESLKQSATLEASFAASMDRWERTMNEYDRLMRQRG